MSRKARKTDHYQRMFEIGYHGRMERYVESECYGDISEDTLDRAVKSMKLPPSNPNLEDDLFSGDIIAKFKVNCFSDAVRNRIGSVIGATKTVEGFIDEQQKHDPDYNRKLRSLFLSLIKELADRGVGGDPLFHGVLRGVEDRILDFKGRGAALPIMAHLFLICDIFLRPEVDE